ncbi:MAG: hypothetical protein WAL09_04695, partial [Pseudolabrys sp.]
RAAGVTPPQVPNAAPVHTLRPLGNVDSLAALRALNHRTRARKSCDVARHFHGDLPIRRGPVPPSFFDIIERAA